MKVKKLLISLIAMIFVLVIWIIFIISSKRKDIEKVSAEKNRTKVSENTLLLSERNIVGLENDKYVCYFNSIIQALYVQTDFMNKIFSYEHNQNQKCIIILKEIFSLMLKGQIISTSNYLKQILDLNVDYKSFKFGFFEDAYVCLSIIFTQILNEINDNRRFNISKIIDFKQFQQEFFLGDLYFFIRKNTIRCSSCHEKTINTINDYTFLLYLEFSIQKSIVNCLNVKNIDCICSMSRNIFGSAKITTEITSLPKNLIIKNSHWPCSNSDVLINEKIFVQNQEYTFNACIFHIKNLHYYTVAIFGNRYYELNDVLVKELNIESIENFGYSNIPDILFYKKSE
ncbi:putative ubiquitin carboxyl-terminal hydrolase [Hamiltosporidium tvaerminnensis]|uniref:Putative ubiquitin carboxyl-terminal hydrolase n=1 Tax=Hamiltosporidium tvaerminnensis TaxID=1176355 RepID=A0A4Q9LCC6_9MICR|nr:putative ubiquitin carboxyl-terminal hydrolase [Hamiltosporidium tvaerminnensis]